MENNTQETVIASDVQITGTIKTSGSVQFHGKLDGELISEGDVTIGKDADIKGNISANAVAMSGSIKGNISAKDRIQMLSTARVLGDIKAKRLTVEDGVTFVGRSEVNPSGQAPAAAQPPPAALGGESKSGGSPFSTK